MIQHFNYYKKIVLISRYKTQKNKNDLKIPIVKWKFIALVKFVLAFRLASVDFNIIYIFSSICKGSLIHIPLSRLNFVCVYVTCNASFDNAMAFSLGAGPKRPSPSPQLGRHCVR